MIAELPENVLDDKPRKVLTVAGVPPESCAYALARYSRSPDSIRQSIEWVRTHDSAKFLESFYFQYGHASIADLGHVVLCLEGISELAATEAEDEQLWDGQARSSRYQEFGQGGFLTPGELTGVEAERYRAAAERLLAGYRTLHGQVLDYLSGKLARPEGMKPDAYRRNLAARAFDVARYLLFLGIPTGVGQVTNIRTLERQIRRLRVSEYEEVRELGAEMAAACARPPDCAWDESSAQAPVAPTLAKYVNRDEHRARMRRDLALWAAQNLAPPADVKAPDVDLLKPAETLAEIVATLLYPVTDRPFRALYEMAAAWSTARQMEVVDVALQSRTQFDDLQREFRSAPYVYDIVMDIGAYRDLHRHRRCQQTRQAYGTALGWATPELLRESGLAGTYDDLLRLTFDEAQALPAPGSHYLLPFATRARFLFKMDFAEAEYIARLRSGVKGHFSYREIAWQMKQRMDEVEPALGRLIEATPPWVEDPLTR